MAKRYFREFVDSQKPHASFHASDAVKYAHSKNHGLTVSAKMFGMWARQQTDIARDNPAQYRKL